ncbi:hypothetical protein [Chryseobacterium sp. MDT2-18]|uniref:hypothetical protein n=1 Tax=Chryseobacterium sp. MDT2-18 TaxID=1259136 RepID=UPI0027D92789|nr:hypothetical protein [Chryseobacterium sp. MDT2-18]
MTNSNRLLAGFYYQKTGNDFPFTVEHHELLKYNLNGNIVELKRFSYKNGTPLHRNDHLNTIMLATEYLL